MDIYRKRTMRKVLAVILILVLSLALVGCKKDKPKQTRTAPPGGNTPPIDLEITPPPGFDTPGFDKVPEVNKTIMQAFYWEMNEGDYGKEFPKEANLWRLLAERAPEFEKMGLTGLWLPPASKAMSGGYSVGYDVYDLWDLGEFDQKGTVRTKYGTRAELDNAIKTLHAHGIEVYFDAVLNHRMGADKREQVPLASGGTEELWTKFTFPGRNDAYAGFGARSEWTWECFDGMDNVLFKDKNWDNCADDYLMGADVDYENEGVQEEIKAWGEWIINEVDFDGFRLDAVKHVDNGYIRDWLEHVQNESGKDVFFVGEAWIEDTNDLKNYIDAVRHPDLKVFDFPLHAYFRNLANIGGVANDMKALADVGLVNLKGYQDRAVTFADNHDTNRDNEASGVHRYKYQAYAYMLTREHGTPCIWWKDFYVYGMHEGIGKLLLARKYYAYGPGHEVPDANDEDVYCYVREGIPGTGTGLVLLLSDGPAGGKQIVTKRINSRQPNTTFYDLTGNVDGTVTTDDEGYGDFKVRMSEGEGWSVWVPMPDTN